MSLESALLTILNTVATRVYPDIAPGHVTVPYITYQQIGGDAPTFVDRAVPNKRNALMQINAYATTRAESMAMMLAVESALTLATTLQALPNGALIADIDDDTDLRTSIQDFMIWGDR